MKNTDKDMKNHEKCNIDEDWDTGKTYCMDHEVRLCQVCYGKIDKEEIACEKHRYTT